MNTHPDARGVPQGGRPRLQGSLWLLAAIAALATAHAQKPRDVIPPKDGGKAVSAERMQAIYQEVRTPYKFGVVLKGEGGRKVDCPSMAWTKNPASPEPWTRLAAPVLTRDQADCRAWEKLTQYKNNVIHDADRSLGYSFVMYYNGKTQSGYEVIGMAVSDDMTPWLRYGKTPVVDNGKGISGDPQIVRIGDTWVMFYFGPFYKPKEIHKS